MGTLQILHMSTCEPHLSHRQSSGIFRHKRQMLKCDQGWYVLCHVSCGTGGVLHPLLCLLRRRDEGIANHLHQLVELSAIPLCQPVARHKQKSRKDDNSHGLWRLIQHPGQEGPSFAETVWMIDASRELRLWTVGKGEGQNTGGKVTTMPMLARWHGLLREPT